MRRRIIEYETKEPLNTNFNVGTSTKPVYVKFTKGNLQASYNNGNPTWRFANNQYDIIGTQDLSKYKENGWYDLFAWGATNCAEEGKTPCPFWTYSSGNYGSDDKYYRPDINSSSSVEALTLNDDWGANIINRQPKNTYVTLTNTEWENLLKNHAHKRSKVGNVNGLLILATGTTINSSYTISQFEQLEENGAVFLPICGYRNGPVSTHSTDFNIFLLYWSRSLSNSFGSNNETSPYYTPYGMGTYSPTSQGEASTQNWRQTGRAVRLVQKV